ncbi:ABC transporter permease [Falsirhodobacter sp. alg1]|uniref:ABC transporter permease n=1 Tax=Falsirhodobacter sp. alg1 TaxID=1472418 RepID=UPI000B218341|nr:ABC transporter permease [Falsirhodobacter sp. alg1]
MARAAGFTLAEVCIGFILGALLGMALALMMTVSGALRAAGMPLLTFSQTVPVFALAPLLTLWLGYGMAPKVAVVMLLTLFPVAAAWLDGLMNPPEDQREVMQSFGATPRQMLLQLRIPAAKPSLATGLRLAAVYAPVGAIIGEWVGGSRGLGAVMIASNARMKTDMLFAALFATVALSLVFRAIIGALAHRIAR